MEALTWGHVRLIGFGLCLGVVTHIAARVIYRLIV